MLGHIRVLLITLVMLMCQFGFGALGAIIDAYIAIHDNNPWHLLYVPFEIILGICVWVIYRFLVEVDVDDPST